MNTFSFITVELLFFFALAVAAVNWKHFMGNYRNRRRGIEKHDAIVPGLSLLFGILAGWIDPHEWGAWIVFPILFDPGTWIVFFIPWMLARRWMSRKDHQE